MKSKDDKYIQISNYVLDSMRYGPFRNLHYVARLEFLKNYHDEEYVSRITKRTGVDKEVLREDSRKYIMNLRVNLISELKKMEFKELLQLMNDEKTMNNFLHSINIGIGGIKDDFFLQKCD